MAIQQAIAFPFEFTTSLRDFSVNYNAGGVTAKTMTLGVCGSVLSAIWKLNAILAAHNADLACYLTTDHKVEIVSISGIATFDIVWTDPALGMLFGFRSDLSGESLYTATDTPKFLWLSNIGSHDVERFDREQRFQGARASDGTVSGINLSPSLYTRNIMWAAEAATNVYQSASTASFSFDGSTQYPQEERCLEYLVDHALSSFPQESTAEGLSTKGSYWVPDLSVFEGSPPTIALTQTWGGGDVQTYLTSSPARYVFCHVNPKGWDSPKPDLKSSLAYYTVGLEMTACSGSVPTWNAP